MAQDDYFNLDDAGPIDHSIATQLLTQLRKIEATNNVLTREQFKEFEPLYRAPKEVDGNKAVVDQDFFSKLSKKYILTIDPYKPTDIYDRDPAKGGKILLTLPPVFMSVHALAPTPENAHLVSVNSKAAQSASFSPREVSDAVTNLGVALLNEQLKPERRDDIHARAALTQEQVNQLKRLYGAEDAPPSADAPPSPEAATINASEWGE